MKISRKLVVTVSAGALLMQSTLLTGCVSTQEARIGPNDGTDVCYANRVALDETRTLFSDDVLTGILAVGVGVVVGVGVAALTGNTSTAAKITGGVIGGLAGGFFSELVKQQGRDQALESALAGAKKENDNLKKTQAAMNELTKCRRQEIRSVKSDYSHKRITKKEGEARLVAIRGRMDRDYEIAQEINANVVKRNGEYRTALGEVNASGKGAKEKRFASETSSALTRGQGIGKSTQAMADARNEAGGLEANLPVGFFALLFG